ncbi:hypothetical protein AVEN_166647-1 [Araneus ventricosus]|uniref:Uncharacterized protein n=1 Tax=Araneus ventricosus TaxID=182803 RepID=A0A4Y2E2W4_ARAVE|nr:hypothetical protein AVEN_166647-1 [Araneus ventricosus]
MERFGGSIRESLGENTPAGLGHSWTRKSDLKRPGLIETGCPHGKSGHGPSCPYGKSGPGLGCSYGKSGHGLGCPYGKSGPGLGCPHGKSGPGLGCPFGKSGHGLGCPYRKSGPGLGSLLEDEIKFVYLNYLQICAVRLAERRTSKVISIRRAVP